MARKKTNQSLRSVKDGRQRKKPGGGDGWAAKLLQDLKKGKGESKAADNRSKEAK